MRPSVMAVQLGCSWVQKAMAKPSYSALQQQTQLGAGPLWILHARQVSVSIRALPARLLYILQAVPSHPGPCP